MIARTWRTRINERAAGDYDDFVRSKSMSMFRGQTGFLAALFISDQAERFVVTIWRDRSNVDALDDSPSYVETVRQLEATGILVGTSTVRVLELDHLLIPDADALTGGQ